MNKYRFNAKRCKAAIETLSDLIRDIPVTDQESRQACQNALDGLIIGLEDLHRRAQERDMLMDALNDLMYEDYIDSNTISEIYDCYTNEKGDLDRIEDLVL